MSGLAPPSGPQPGGTPLREIAASRPSLTAAVLLLMLLVVPGLLVAHGTADRLLDGLLLALLLGAPVVLRVEGPRALWRRRRPLAILTLLGTASWDVSTALLGRRALLSEWPLVYGSGLAAFAVIYLMQAAVAARIVRLEPDGTEWNVEDACRHSLKHRRWLAWPRSWRQR